MTENLQPPPLSSDASLGELISQVSEQTSRLVRDEMRLARAEMTQKGKKAGLGVGLFGGAGLLALYGLACFVAAAILALAGPVPDWVAAVIVGAALVIVAAVAALIGKREVSQATPLLPAEAVDGIKQDLQAVKPGEHS